MSKGPEGIFDFTSQLWVHTSVDHDPENFFNFLVNLCQDVERWGLFVPSRSLSLSKELLHFPTFVDMKQALDWISLNSLKLSWTDECNGKPFVDLTFATIQLRIHWCDLMSMWFSKPPTCARRRQPLSWFEAARFEACRTFLTDNGLSGCHVFSVLDFINNSIQETTCQNVTFQHRRFVAWELQVWDFQCSITGIAGLSKRDAMVLSWRFASWT